MPETGRRRAARGSVLSLEPVPGDARPRGVPVAAEASSREPAFCPQCGASLAGRESLVQEYWAGSETFFYCWCRACSFTGDVVFVERVVTHEAAE